MVKEDVKRDRVTEFYEGMKRLRKKRIPKDLKKQINENVEQDEALEKKEPEKKRKIAGPLDNEAGL